MSSKNIPILDLKSAASALSDFSSACRERFSFFHGYESGDVRALRYALYGDAVRKLISELPLGARGKLILLDMMSVSPETALSSIVKDAKRIGADSVLKKIQTIRESFSESAFERVMSPRGMGPNEHIPMHYWIQLGEQIAVGKDTKKDMPYFRMWAGFRSPGICSRSALPRPLLKRVISIRQAIADEFPSVKTACVRVAHDGRIHALAVECDMRLFVSLSEAHLARYEEGVRRSKKHNGASVKYALTDMLCEILGPSGINIPLEPIKMSGLIKDISPLQTFVKHHD